MKMVVESEKVIPFIVKKVEMTQRKIDRLNSRMDEINNSMKKMSEKRDRLPFLIRIFVNDPNDFDSDISFEHSVIEHHLGIQKKKLSKLKSILSILESSDTVELTDEDIKEYNIALSC